MNGSFVFRGMRLPEELREHIDNYVHYGIPTGGFLQAVIDNDLTEACGRADDNNLRILPAVVAYFYNHASFGCWGFAGAHDRWVKKKLEDRKKKSAEGN